MSCLRWRAYAGEKDERAEDSRGQTRMEGLQVDTEDRVDGRGLKRTAQALRATYEARRRWGRTGVE